MTKPLPFADPARPAVRASVGDGRTRGAPRDDQNRTDRSIDQVRGNPVWAKPPSTHSALYFLSNRLSTEAISDQLPSGFSKPNRRSEEQTSELQSLMRNSYAVFCLNKKKHKTKLKTSTRN